MVFQIKINFKNEKLRGPFCGWKPEYPEENHPALVSRSATQKTFIKIVISKGGADHNY